MSTEIKRNIEAGGIYLNHFWTGVVTNRSPLFTPISSMGIQMIQRMDCLFGGLNMEISPKATLWRRYGFAKFCTTAFSSSLFPQVFYGFKNLANTIYPIVDTTTNVYTFTGSSLTSIFTKAGGAGRSSFITVGNFLYYCDGVSVPQKWNGTNAWQWGIATPTVTPGLSYTAGSLSPTSGYTYVYAYYNSTTGHISSASPASADTGPLTSKNITVSYTASTDPQVSNIWIFRTADGGGLFYFLASVANTTSNYTDSTPDTGLNTFLVAPVSGVNNPPPAGMAHIAFYAGFAFGSVGNVLYYSNGPNTTIGVGTEAWPAANNFTLPGNITCMKPVSAGLAIFTTDDVYILAGYNITSFTLLPWQINFGVLTESCVTQDGDVLYVFTSRGLFYAIQYGVALSEIGFNIRTNLAVISPLSAYVTLHRNGADEGLFVSDGAANIWRYGMDFGCWSPVSQPLQGCSCIGSIETAVGTWSLLMGISTGSSFIFYRDPGTYVDNGTAYTCSVIIGSLVVAPPGNVAVIDKVLIQTITGSGTWTYPTISVLPNNISGTFTTLPNPIGDPATLAGTAYESTNPLCKFHAWKGAATPLPQATQNLQVQIAYTTDVTQSELLGVGLG